MKHSGGTPHVGGSNTAWGECPHVDKEIPLVGAIRVLVQSEFGRFSRPESQLLPLNGKQLGPSYPPNRAFFKREIAMKVTSDLIIAMKVTSDSIIDAFNTVKNGAVKFK